MPRTMLWGMAFILSVVVLGCSSENDSSEPPATPVPQGGGLVTPPPPEEGVVFGRLKDAKTKEPIGAAQISVGNTTVATNESGFFFTSLPPNQEHLLRMEAPGYARTSQRVKAQAGISTFVEFSLLPFGKTLKFDAATGATISSEGAEVVFSANSLNAEGEVTASLARLDAEKREQLAAFPGGFRTNTGELLESFGALAIEVRDEKGALVNLKSGEVAQATIPASANVPAGDIPLWTYDEEAGVWREEGKKLTGCQSGNCSAELPHLSWWNADIVTETTCLTVCAVDVNDTPAVGISFEATGVDYNGSSTAFGGTDGCACLAVRIQSEIEVMGVTSGGIVKSNRISTDTTPLSCGNPACAKLPAPLKVAAPKFQAILTWGAKPSDLDSHFTGPCPYADCTEERFHVYYSDQGSLFKAPFAYLDTDDTSSFGPEITSLAVCSAGIYRYSVYNYSGEDSGPLVDSEAKVLVILPDGNIHTYAVPDSNPDKHRLWVVGELNCSGVACQCSWAPINAFMPGESDSPHFHPGVAGP